MNTSINTQKLPLIEPNAAIYFFLSLVQGGTISDYVDALEEVKALEADKALKHELEALCKEAGTLEEAITAFIKIRLPKVPNYGSRKFSFFSAVTANIQQCPLHLLLSTINGVEQLRSHRPELERVSPPLNEADYILEFNLAESIRHFLGNYACLLEMLAADDLESFDYKKSLRESLNGSDADTATQDPTAVIADNLDHEIHLTRANASDA